MVDSRRTDELVELFNQNPGAECHRLDFKSKEILDSTSGKKKLVRQLSAFANHEGGTVIVGVRRNEDGLLVQDFEVNEEIRQELSHIAIEYTTPILTNLWDISFDTHLGSNLLRIDVPGSEGQLIKFLYDGEWTPFYRDEDGIRKMTFSEMENFVRNRERRDIQQVPNGISLNSHVDVTPANIDQDSIPQPLKNRTITRIGGEASIVFSSGFLWDTLRKTHTYRITQNAFREYSDILSFLEAANEHLDTRGDYEFGYSIRVGDVELVSKTVKNLREDIDRIDRLHHELSKITTEDWSYQPLITGAISTRNGGLLWFEAQRETETFIRGEFEIRLPDLPIDDTALRNFLNDVGSTDGTYQHQSGLQFATLRGGNNEPLQNVQPSNLLSDSTGPLFITADNPLFEKQDVLVDQVDSPLPWWITEELTKVHQIPFQVSGGLVLDGGSEFTINYIHTTMFSGTYPTLIVDPVCWQRGDDSIAEEGRD